MVSGMHRAGDLRDDLDHPGRLVMHLLHQLSVRTTLYAGFAAD
jgi:hypothetical protein